jgi:tetrahydromethanopterin S-methyltransferase subunit G
MSEKKGEKLDSIQAEIDRTKGVMKTNIEKTLARGEKLEALEEKADTLNSRARTFQSNARQVRRNFCMQYWRNIVVGILILVVSSSVFLPHSLGSDHYPLLDLPKLACLVLKTAVHISLPNEPLHSHSFYNCAVHGL